MFRSCLRKWNESYERFLMHRGPRSLWLDGFNQNLTVLQLKSSLVFDSARREKSRRDQRPPIHP